MRRLVLVVGISVLLISEGCDKGLVAEDEKTLLSDSFQRLLFDEEVTGQLSPFELIENPDYTPIHEIDYISDDELVFVSKACGFVLVYPHRNMIVEAVNEEAHGVLMAVTYCPITRSGIS